MQEPRNFLLAKVGVEGSNPFARSNFLSSTDEMKTRTGRDRVRLLLFMRWRVFIELALLFCPVPIEVRNHLVYFLKAIIRHEDRSCRFPNQTRKGS